MNTVPLSAIIHTPPYHMVWNLKAAVQTMWLTYRIIWYSPLEQKSQHTVDDDIESLMPTSKAASNSCGCQGDSRIHGMVGELFTPKRLILSCLTLAKDCMSSTSVFLNLIKILYMLLEARTHAQLPGVCHIYM